MRRSSWRDSRDALSGGSTAGRFIFSAVGACIYGGLEHWSASPIGRGDEKTTSPNGDPTPAESSGHKR